MNAMKKMDIVLKATQTFAFVIQDGKVNLVTNAVPIGSVRRQTKQLPAPIQMNVDAQLKSKMQIPLAYATIQQ